MFCTKCGTENAVFLGAVLAIFQAVPVTTPSASLPARLIAIAVFNPLPPMMTFLKSRLRA